MGEYLGLALFWGMATLHFCFYRYASRHPDKYIKSGFVFQGMPKTFDGARDSAQLALCFGLIYFMLGLALLLKRQSGTQI